MIKRTNTLWTFDKVIVVTMLATMLAYAGCKNDDEGTDPTMARLQQLEGTWTLGNVQNDGNDVTAQFNDFQLKLTAGQTFTTQNGGNAWPASGSFSFVEGDVDRVLRDDGVTLDVVSISTESLVLTFTQSRLNGRTAGITGSFIFSLVK